MFLRKGLWVLAVMGALILTGCGGGGSGGAGVQTTPGSPTSTPAPTPVVSAGENLFITSNDATYAARITVKNLTTGATRKISEVQGNNLSCWSIAYDPVTGQVLMRCSQTTGTAGNLPYWWYDPTANTITNTSFPAVTPRLVNSSTSTVTVGNNIWMAEGLLGVGTDISVLVNTGGVISVTKITLPIVNGYVTRLQLSSDKNSVFALTSNGDVHKLAVGTPPTLSYTIPNTGSASNFLVTGGKVYVVNDQEVKVYDEATGVADVLEPTISVAGIGPAVPTLFAIGFNGTDLVLAGNEGVWGYTLATKTLAFHALDAAATYREVVVLADGDSLLLENKGVSATKVLRSPKSTPRITTEVSSIPGTIRIQVLTY
jgi:hypothetical protein